MSGPARVESVDALKHFREAMWKFHEAADTALADAEGEIHRTLVWLENEQYIFWNSQIRKRQELVARCKEAVRMKKLFKDSSGRTQSSVDEEKQLQIAMRKLQEAEQKLVNVKRWAQRLQKELHLYKGSVQRFQTTVSADIPVAVAKLDKMVGVLEQYVSLSTPVLPGMLSEAASAVNFAELGGSSMARSTDAAASAAADYAKLRKLTPGLDERVPLKVASLTVTTWVAGSLGDAQRQTLAELHLSQDLPAAGAKLVIAREIWNCPRIYLQRLDTNDAADSGWYVGPAEGTTAIGYEAIAIADLLAVRAEFRDILALPPGFLVVMDGGGVVVLLDGFDHDRWPAPPAPPAAPATDERRPGGETETSVRARP